MTTLTQINLNLGYLVDSILFCLGANLVYQFLRNATNNATEVPWLTLLVLDAARGESRLGGTTRFLKRLIDVVGATLLLLLTWPVMLLAWRNYLPICLSL